MKLNLSYFNRAAITAAMVALTLNARADAEDVISRSFKVQAGGQLAVDADRGSIEIKTVDKGEAVDVQISRKATGSQAKATKALEDHIVTTKQDGNKVEVHSEYKGPTVSGWFNSSPNLQVRYVITIPRQFDVNLKTAGGSIKVNELIGKTQVKTSGGSITLDKIEGPVQGHTSGGSVNVAGCRGAVDVSTSGGNMTLSGIEGDVNARTSGGSIKAEKITGNSVVKTSGGSVTVSGVTGSVDAGTSGGSVNAELLAQPASNCTFKTSGGSITVALLDKAAVDVDLRTSGGRVSSDFPVTTVIQGEQSKNEIRGKVNGGGPLITAHTSGGSVRLQKN